MPKSEKVDVLKDKKTDKKKKEVSSMISCFCNFGYLARFEVINEMRTFSYCAIFRWPLMNLPMVGIKVISGM
jgi:hypothetical protein